MDWYVQYCNLWGVQLWETNGFWLRLKRKAGKKALYYSHVLYVLTSIVLYSIVYTTTKFVRVQCDAFAWWSAFVLELAERL